MWRFSGRYLRVIGVWVALLPFALLSLLANGIMPAMSSNGVVMLVICTGDGMVEMAFDSATMEPVADTTESDGEPTQKADYCSWAASHPAFDLPDLVAVQQPDTTLTVLAPPRGPSILQIAAATGLPPATGPPVLF
ncbi:DUF2946 family protein [Pseudochelatococcus contaminans]|nr:DUF2946 family protein [Pseudochelatococcus contaminans]